MPIAFTMDRDQYGKWWITNYHQLTEKDCKWVKRANKVFSRMYDAADKRTNRDPKLIMIKKDKRLIARCLEDGSIIITQKTLEFCYENIKKISHYSKKDIGDTRLAFILGHEMAHLACDDHWFTQKRNKAFIEDSSSYNTDVKENRPSINKHFVEFRADEYGLIYTALAGFQVDILFRFNFFEEWIDQLTDKKALQSYKPSAQSRYKNIEFRLSKIRSQLIYYDMGIRLFHSGKYEKALDFLKHFNRTISSREVYHNIGLIYFQQALEKRLYFEPDFLKGFKLSTIVDLRSKLKKTIGRNKLSESDISRYRQEFQKKNQQAMRYFRQAIQKDPFYDLSALHLGLCHIINKNYDKAIFCFNEIYLKDNKKYKAFLEMNQSIADFLKNCDHITPSILYNTFKKFKTIIQKRPDYWLAQYNMHILKKNFDQFGHHPAYWSDWSDYFNSSHAKRFENVICEIDSNVMKIQKNFSFIKPPHLRPGQYYNLKVHGFKKVFEDEFLYSVELYTDSNNNRLLVLGKILELLEFNTNIPVPVDITTVTPRRVYDTCSKIQTWVFDRMTLDIKNGKVVSVLYF